MRMKSLMRKYQGVPSDVARRMAERDYRRLYGPKTQKPQTTTKPQATGYHQAPPAPSGVKLATQQTTGKLAEYRNKDLGSFRQMSEKEMNDWIAQKAPKDSPFQGQARIFLEASQKSGLDPRYILAHAALESGWGKSRISREKHNYFGIGAFDSSPYSSAYTFGGQDQSGLAAGIIEGSKWIADHYYNGKYGQRTLYQMRWNDNVHQYATDEGWDTKIASIMSSAPE